MPKRLFSLGKWTNKRRWEESAETSIFPRENGRKMPALENGRAETSIFPRKMDEKCLQNGRWKMDVGPRAPGEMDVGPPAHSAPILLRSCCQR